MDRRLLVAAVATLLACGVPAAQATGIKIEASAQGVKVQAAGLQGSAPRLSYDEAKGILMLEGTKDVPATLVRSRNGHSDEVRAAKIIYSLKDGAVQAESVQSIGGPRP